MDHRSKIYNGAADLLENVGWCQMHSALDDKGAVCSIDSSSVSCFCATGAIERTLIEDNTLPPYSPAYYGFWSETNDLFHIAKGTDYGYISDWNDEPGRTREEVVSMLRSMAEKAE